jgi:hypothetical protein
VEAVSDTKGGLTRHTKEALAMLAFLELGGYNTSKIAWRFHRKRDTVRKALNSANRPG